MSEVYGMKDIRVTWDGKEFSGYTGSTFISVPPADCMSLMPIMVSCSVTLLRDGPPVNFAQMLLSSRRRWKRGQKLNRGGRRRARAKHAESMADRDADELVAAIEHLTMRIGRTT